MAPKARSRGMKQVLLQDHAIVTSRPFKGRVHESFFSNWMSPNQIGPKKSVEVKFFTRAFFWRAQCHVMEKLLPYQ